MIAAEQTGSEGHVWVYEGSKEMATLARETIAINNLDEVVTVKHAVVGQKISLRESSTEENYSRVNPEELPDCDVIELDCEGAEIGILENTIIRPKVILVETHGIYGALTSEVKSILSDKGHEIISIQVAAPGDKYCIDNDIKVVSEAR